MYMHKRKAANKDMRITTEISHPQIFDLSNLTKKSYFFSLNSKTDFLSPKKKSQGFLKMQLLHSESF